VTVARLLTYTQTTGNSCEKAVWRSIPKGWPLCPLQYMTWFETSYSRTILSCSDQARWEITHSNMLTSRLESICTSPTVPQSFITDAQKRGTGASAGLTLYLSYPGHPVSKNRSLSVPSTPLPIHISPYSTLPAVQCC
jgi:hypothetical protein